ACYTRIVSARKLVGAAIVAICVAVPLAETFDSWDHTAQDGNDTEANVVIVALCVGLVLSIVPSLGIVRFRALPRAVRVDLTPRVARFETSILSPIPTISPPAILRR